LPFAVNLDEATAEFEQGILRIELPRHAARNIVPRKVEGDRTAQEG